MNGLPGIGGSLGNDKSNEGYADWLRNLPESKAKEVIRHANLFSVLLEALRKSHYELNAIRARCGVPYWPTGKSDVDERYFYSVVDECTAAIALAEPVALARQNESLNHTEKGKGMTITEDEAEALVQALNWARANAQDRNETKKMKMLSGLQDKARQEWMLLVTERRIVDSKKSDNYEIPI